MILYVFDKVEIGRREGRVQTIVFLRDIWWPQTTKQDGGWINNSVLAQFTEEA